jgi:beta-mannanase
MGQVGIWRTIGAGLAATMVLMTAPTGLSAASNFAPTEQPAPAVALGLYRPEFPNDLKQLTALESAAGTKLAIVHWYALWGGWKSAFNAGDLKLVSDRGYLPMITWEPWAGTAGDPGWSLRSAILSGSNDAYIDTWARGLADYRLPVLLRFAHEMHDQTYPWAVGVNGNTASDYVAAWRHVRAIFAHYRTDNVKWVWNPNTMGGWSAAQYWPVYRALYPGDDQVDWVALDIYNTGPSLDWGAPYWRSFEDVLSEPYKAITAVSTKPLIIPEVGSAEAGGSKADWTARAMSAQLLTSFPRLRALVWFDVNKEAPWAITSSEPSLQAWLAAAGQPAFQLTPPELLAAAAYQPT